MHFTLLTTRSIPHHHIEHNNNPTTASQTTRRRSTNDDEDPIDNAPHSPPSSVDNCDLFVAVSAVFRRKRFKTCLTEVIPDKEAAEQWKNKWRRLLCQVSLSHMLRLPRHTQSRLDIERSSPPVHLTFFVVILLQFICRQFLLWYPVTSTGLSDAHPPISSGGGGHSPARELLN